MGSDSPNSTGRVERLAQISDVIGTRRSNLRVDPYRPVASELVSQLLDLAQQAVESRIVV